MGLIDRLMGGHTTEERTAKGLSELDKVAAGKGIAGRLTRAFVTEDQFERIQSSAQMIHDQQAAAAIVQAGAPTVQAKVVSVDGGSTTVNNSPLLSMILEISDGSPTGVTQVSLQAIVALSHIPRPGDIANLAVSPAVPGGYIYVGLAA